MPYTASQATIGKGSSFLISISGTPTLVGEINKITQSGKKQAIVNVTNLESTAEEKLGSLPDYGSWQIEGNRLPGVTDAGQAALSAAFDSGSLTSFTVQLPKGPGQSSVGDKYVFNGIVEDLNIDGLEPKKNVMLKATIAVSGTPAFTAGS
jgi:hypothetical protein